MLWRGGGSLVRGKEYGLKGFCGNLLGAIAGEDRGTERWNLAEEELGYRRVARAILAIEILEIICGGKSLWTFVVDF